LALITAVMLIVFASVAVLGVTVFIVQRLSQSHTTRTLTSCIYLAQAGIHQAIYWFRFNDLTANGHFSLGQASIDAQNFFVLGGTAADFLMVNTANSSLGGGPNRDLDNLSLQNATDSRTITIDRMIVTWNRPRALKIIRINNNNVWSGTASSPADVNISNFTLNTVPAIYAIDYLRFNGSMAGSTIGIQFIMTDGSAKTLTVYPASNNYRFTVKSTGQTADSNIYRTIQAEYNVNTGKVTGYNEINAKIAP